MTFFDTDGLFPIRYRYYIFADLEACSQGHFVNKKYRSSHAWKESKLPSIGKGETNAGGRNPLSRANRFEIILY